MSRITPELRKTMNPNIIDLIIKKSDNTMATFIGTTYL